MVRWGAPYFVGIMGAVFAISYAVIWFREHPEYQILALAIAIYAGAFLLGLLALYIIVRVIRAAWYGGRP